MWDENRRRKATGLTERGRPRRAPSARMVAEEVPEAARRRANPLRLGARGNIRRATARRVESRPDAA
jgi:hypothetical protein